MKRIEIPYEFVEKSDLFREIGATEVSRTSYEASYPINSSEEIVYHMPQGVTLKVSNYTEQKRIQVTAFGDEVKIGEVEKIIADSLN